jgi:hypothetical protein
MRAEDAARDQEPHDPRDEHHPQEHGGEEHYDCKERRVHDRILTYTVPSQG